MSEREYVVQEIMAHLSSKSEVWNAPWGVIESKSADNKYREITFGRAAILDASIKVYSPTFVTLTWRTAIRSMPSAGFHVFKGMTTFEDICTFLERNFA